jgi:arabinose-5-phosphate isomerase
MARTRASSSAQSAGERAKVRLAQALEVIRLEARTIARLEAGLGASFLDAVDRLLACRGLVVVTGMGKAGLVGAKVSATLASTGTPSLALHPTEAMHGDLGRIRKDDLVLVLSNSGETGEILFLLPHIRRIGAQLVAMTGAPESQLARLSDCVLDIGRVDEACPLGLAPTASTSAMMALGDALALVVMKERGFSREDYARNHPYGSLGRRLMKVREIMRQGDELPLVAPERRVREVLHTMTVTRGRPGAALVVGLDGRLCGIFTDGDLRRLLEREDAAILDRPVREFMGCEPKTIGPDALVEEAERVLRELRIDQLAVLDDDRRPIGLLDVQDLLHTRF